MTTGRINQVASSYDAVSPDARGLAAGGPGSRAVVRGGRARLAARRASLVVRGVGACPSRELSLPDPRARRGPSHGRRGFDAPSAGEGRSHRVRPAAPEGRWADGALLGDVDSFALGTQHRKPGSAREAWELSAPGNDGRTCGRFDAQARSPAALVGLLPLTRITGAFPAPHERPAADLSHPRVLDGVGRATLSATNGKSGRSGLRDGPHPRRVEESSGARQSGLALILDATRNHRARINRVNGRVEDSPLPRRGIIGRASRAESDSPAPGAGRGRSLADRPRWQEVAIRARGPLAHASVEALAHHEGMRTLPPI